MVLFGSLKPLALSLGGTKGGASVPWVQGLMMLCLRQTERSHWGACRLAKVLLSVDAVKTRTSSSKVDFDFAAISARLGDDHRLCVPLDTKDWECIVM